MSFRGRKTIPNDIRRRAEKVNLDKADFYVGPLVTSGRGEANEISSKSEIDEGLEARMEMVERPTPSAPDTPATGLRGFLRHLR